MPQILEVVVAMVVSAMMATAITTLALSPVKTQRQKNVYAASEAAAIAVRKCIVNNPVVFKADTDITATNVSNTCLKTITLGQDITCQTKTNYQPSGTLVSVPTAIECSQSSSQGTMAGLAWQPLYTVNAMMTQAGATTTTSDFNVCMTKWFTDSSAVYTGSAAPTSENLATKYPTECGGIANPFKFDQSGYNSGESPCGATIKIGTSGTSSTTVRFGTGTCGAP